MSAGDVSDTRAVLGADAETIPGAAPSLRTSVISGVRWKLLGQGVAQAMRSAVAIVLARLLAPHDYGEAAVALIYIGVTGIFTDLALSAALVQRKEITEEDRSTAFWTTVAVGSLLAVVGVLLSPVIAAALTTPSATPLIAATSGIVLLSSLSLTQTALLTRELRFRSLELRNFVATLVGAGVAVPLAVYGFGAWAIVSQAIVSTAVATVLVWIISPWRPHRVYSRKSLNNLGSFGIKTVVAQILGMLSLYADNMLIARFLGSAALGIYSVAYNVMFVPVARVAQPIQNVLFAGFAKLQGEPERLREAWLTGTIVVSSLNAAAFLGMAVVAPDFVLVVLGQKWAASVRVLQLLSLAGVSTSFMTLNWATLQALGRAGTSLRLRLFSVPLVITAFAIGLHWGVEGVAGFYAIARAIVVVVSTFVTCRVLGARYSTVVRRLSRVLGHCLAMAVFVFALRRLVLTPIDPGPRLALCALCGIIFYVGIVWWRDRELVGQLRGLLARR
jgi:O-antigen/teichoic acid export membrane protein